MKEMTNITPEIIEKAKAAKTAEELLALAKENDVKMTEEEAKAYFAQLNPVSGELSDEELDNVAGGWCYHDGDRVVTAITMACSDWICDQCGSKSELLDDGSRRCKNMLEHEEKFVFRSYCSNCKYYKYENALSLCTHHHG